MKSKCCRLISLWTMTMTFITRAASAIFATRNYLLIQGSLLVWVANAGCTPNFGSTSGRYQQVRMRRHLIFVTDCGEVNSRSLERRVHFAKLHSQKIYFKKIHLGVIHFRNELEVEFWKLLVPVTFQKHRKNCECCPVSLLTVRSQTLSQMQQVSRFVFAIVKNCSKKS